MYWLIIISSALLLLILGAWIYLIAPGSKRGMDEFIGVKFAHRGLHDSKYAENSLSAFARAVDAGFGIELDVRLSADGELVVFHDDTLERVCGDGRRVIDLTADELSKISLCGTPDTVPTFKQVLSLVNGKVPLLVEIKEGSGDSSVTEATVKMLKTYDGKYIVESFNPYSVKGAKLGLGKIPCGILATASYGESDKQYKLRNFALTNLLTNVICRPAFIAYDRRGGGAFSRFLSGLIFRAPRIAWTVRSKDEEREAYKHGYDTVIFENYIPEKN